MDSTEQTKFVAAITACAEYYGKDISPSIIGLYWQGLQGFSLGAVKHALTLHMANPDSGQFMPKIADIVRLAEGSGEEAAMIAWTKVDQAVRHIGPYSDVVFDDPIIHRVLSDMGGWISLTEKTDKDWPFIAKEFAVRYRGYRGRGGVTEYPPLLTGIVNAHNVRLGYEATPPALLGDESKARKVLAGGSNARLLSSKPLAEFLPAPSEEHEPEPA